MSPGPAASAATSESEDSGPDGQQNEAKKRKRLMTISCVTSPSPQSLTLASPLGCRVYGLIHDMDSCELCKLRKVKCDRVEPTCGWCARNDRVCEYKERKKPGLRAGYGRELEGRIDRLEALIHAQGSRLEDHIYKHDASNPAQSTTLSGDPSTEASRHGDCSYGV